MSLKVKLEINMNVIWMAILMIFSLSSQADTVTGQVSRIYANGNHINFKLKGDTCNDLSNNEYYKFTPDTEIKKYWSALLLAAANTGKPIRVQISACSTEGNPIGSKEVGYIYQDF